MIGFQYFFGALADNDAGGHGVAGCHPWHDGSIGDTQILDPIDFEIGIYHRPESSHPLPTFSLHLYRTLPSWRSRGMTLLGKE